MAREHGEPVSKPAPAGTLNLDEFFDQQAAWRLEGEAWRLAGEQLQSVLVPCRCGHEDVVNLPLATYPNTIERLFARWCADCEAKMAAVHAPHDEQVAHRAKEMGLPQLRGSEKQVDWAMNLRNAAIAQHTFEYMEPALLVLTDAKWWIDNRRRLHDFRVIEEGVAGVGRDAEG